MKLTMVVSTVTVAVATAVVTVLCGPSTLDAVDQELSNQQTIGTPKLICNGVELTLTPVAPVYVADDIPQFDLRAVNTRSATTAVRVQLQVRVSSPESRVSRVLVIPQPIWTDVRELTLKPNERAEMLIPGSVKLPANQQIEVVLTADSLSAPAIAGGKAATASSVVMLTFGTQLPATVPARKS